MNMEEMQKKKSLWFRLMEARRMFAQLPFLTTIVVLMLIYIFNVHLAERKMRKIQEIEQEVTQVRWEYISLHSDLINNTTPSRTAERVDDLGLKWGEGRPIVINKVK